MAGGWGHIVADDEAGDHRYAGTRLLENGDWTEAIEELYGMVMHLSGGHANLIDEARDSAVAALKANDARTRA